MGAHTWGGAQDTAGLFSARGRRRATNRAEKEMKFYLNVRKCLFAGRVVNHGSRLPSEAEEFPSLEMMSGHSHEQPALGRAGWGWPRSDQSQGGAGLLP